MVEANNIEWDVVQSIGMWIKPGAAKGYWEALDYTTIDKSGVPDTLPCRRRWATACTA